ncbi:hypothetical protein I3760_10G084800 [Carya illinoinensis]|nr:hypothetical protein I3760_10G084800 [Carya illinoinensis]
MVWKYIMKGWEDFIRDFKFVEGRGTRVRIWVDVWCGDVALKETFPSLFRIALHKEASVADYMDSSNGLLQYNVSFIRSVQDWEVGDISDFYNTLYALNLEWGVEEKLLWTHPGNNNFSVISLYNALSTHPSTAFPWKRI